MIEVQTFYQVFSSISFFKSALVSSSFYIEYMMCLTVPEEGTECLNHKLLLWRLMDYDDLIKSFLLNYCCPIYIEKE